jgi:hypothetical protein
MIVASIGKAPKAKIVQQLYDYDPLVPGAYLVTVDITGPEATLKNRGWAQQQIQKFANRLLDEMQKNDPTTPLWWRFVYAEIVVDDAPSGDNKARGKLNLIFEVQETKTAAVSVWIVAKIIAILAGVVAAIFLGIELSKPVVYSVRLLGQGMVTTADVLSKLMPILIPAILVILLLDRR